jgi:hypothetical protein
MIFMVLDVPSEGLNCFFKFWKQFRNEEETRRWLSGLGSLSWWVVIGGNHLLSKFLHGYTLHKITKKVKA